MYSKIAFANSTRVFHHLRFNSSICIEDQNDSIIALSRPSPPPPQCAGCGRPARATAAADLPGYGLRWLDRCRDCFLATVGMTPGRVPDTVEQVLADVRAAAFEAGVSPVILARPGRRRTSWLSRAGTASAGVFGVR